MLPKGGDSVAEGTANALRLCQRRVAVGHHANLKLVAFAQPLKARLDARLHEPVGHVRRELGRRRHDRPVRACDLVGARQARVVDSPHLTGAGCQTPAVAERGPQCRRDAGLGSETTWGMSATWGMSTTTIATGRSEPNNTTTVTNRKDEDRAAIM